MMKHVMRNGFFILLAAVLFSGIGMKMTGEAAVQYKEMCDSKVLSKTKVKITWKKQKGVSGYMLYRSVLQSDGSYSSRKKIAALSSDRKSYIDKAVYKKSYVYEVVAFSKKNGRKTPEYSGKCYAYMGADHAYWEESLLCDAVTTPKSIRLEICRDGAGITPIQYEIYRSKTKKNFKRIATVEGVFYTDKKVQFGESYYYKVRSVAKVGKEKIYGKYSPMILLSAVKSEGEYQMKLLTPAAETVTSLEVMLTSGSGNAELLLNNRYLWNIDYYCEGQDIFNLTSVSYSFDGEKWQDFTEEMICVKPGEKIYLRFAREAGKAFAYPDTDMEYCYLEVFDMEYNGLTSYMKIDFVKNAATVYPNKEYYH